MPFLLLNHPFADARSVSAIDLENGGVKNHPHIIFYKDRPQEVSQEVADFLLSSELYAGEFELVEEPAPDSGA